MVLLKPSVKHWQWSIQRDISELPTATVGGLFVAIWFSLMPTQKQNTAV